MQRKATPALAYVRTSSATNVDGDSEPRQRAAIVGFAKRAGYQIVDTFSDMAVSGADPIDQRPGFRALLERIVSNCAKVVIVEDASRFARHLLTQEAGVALLVGLGVRVLTANGDDLTDSDDEFRVAMRQIMGAFSQLEKTRLVKKLKVARDRKRATGKKVEGRKAHAELRPEVVKLAKELRSTDTETGRRPSYHSVSLELERRGYRNERGHPYNHKSVRAMVRS